MKNLKRNIIVFSVLVFVCAAVYLNWSYNKGDDASAAGQTAAADDKTTDTAAAENTELTDIASVTENEDAESAGLYYVPETVETGVSEYFAQIRLTRAQARDSAVETLSTVSETEGASQETVDTALSEIALVAKYTMLEAEIEGLILAKGFDECVVFINDGGIDVAVPVSGEGLSSAAVAQITDIVLTETDFEAENLTIIEVRE